jgi:hypothetical protein
MWPPAYDTKLPLYVEASPWEPARGSHGTPKERQQTLASEEHWGRRLKRVVRPVPVRLQAQMWAAVLAGGVHTPAFPDGAEQHLSRLVLLGGNQRVCCSLCSGSAGGCSPLTGQRSRPQALPPGRGTAQLQPPFSCTLPIEREALPDGVGLREALCAREGPRVPPTRGRPTLCGGGRGSLPDTV